METNVDVLIAEPGDAQAEMTLLGIRTAAPEAASLRLKSGEQALHFLFCMGDFRDRAPEMPQLILLELQLPVLNGLHVLDVLRRQDATRQVPVVLFTSRMDPLSIESSYTLGANGYIVKPDETEKYLAAIGGILDRWLLPRASTADATADDPQLRRRPT